MCRLGLLCARGDLPTVPGLTLGGLGVEGVGMTTTEPEAPAPATATSTSPAATPEPEPELPLLTPAEEIAFRKDWDARVVPSPGTGGIRHPSGATSIVGSRARPPRPAEPSLPHPCCVHCIDDPDYHADGTVGHEASCGTCDSLAGMRANTKVRSLAEALALPAAPPPPALRALEPGHGRVLLEVTLGQEREPADIEGGWSCWPTIEGVRVLMHTVDDATLRMLSHEGTEMDFSELDAAIATLGDAPEVQSTPAALRLADLILGGANPVGSL